MPSELDRNILGTVAYWKPLVKVESQGDHGVDWSFIRTSNRMSCLDYSRAYVVAAGGAKAVGQDQFKKQTSTCVYALTYLSFISRLIIA
eukprot:scaffold442_cov268-Pinguiococcus_pyrenoidosus.AAC.85